MVEEYPGRAATLLPWGPWLDVRISQALPGALVEDTSKFLNPVGDSHDGELLYRILT